MVRTKANKGKMVADTVNQEETANFHSLPNQVLERRAHCKLWEEEIMSVLFIAIQHMAGHHALSRSSINMLSESEAGKHQTPKEEGGISTLRG